MAAAAREGCCDSRGTRHRWADWPARVSHASSALASQAGTEEDEGAEQSALVPAQPEARGGVNGVWRLRTCGCARVGCHPGTPS